MWRGLGSMNKGPNATICLVRRQNHVGTTVSWTTVQREKSSHAYKISLNVQTACSTDSLSNCPKHSILRFSSFALKNLLMIENVSTQLTVTGPRSAVGNVSGYRCEADCRSRGREFDPGPVPYFHGD